MKEFLKTVKGIITLAIIIFAVGLIAGYWGKKSVYPDEPIIKRDTVIVAKEIIKWKDVESHKPNFVENILGTHQVEKPIEVSTSKPNPSPLVQQFTKHDTVYTEKSYNYDFIFYGDVGKNYITITTLNPFLEQRGNDYLKTYKFKRTGENFLFSSVKDSTQGIKLVWNDSPIKWRGWRIGGAFGQPGDWYLFFGARVEIYNFGIETQIRAHETPMWITLDYRF